MAHRSVRAALGSEIRDAATNAAPTERDRSGRHQGAPTTRTLRTSAGLAIAFGLACDQLLRHAQMLFQRWQRAARILAHRGGNVVILCRRLELRDYLAMVLLLIARVGHVQART